MPSHSTKILNTGALVIGSGISGLFTALKLAEAGVETMLVTKSAVEENNSRYAQGGIAAVLPSNTGDSIDLHIQDTIKASAGLCDAAAVRSILGEGYEAILDLLDHGVTFDRNPNNDDELALTKEAAHSVKRILHAAGDATGHSVEMTLIERVKAHPKISVLDYCHVVSLRGSCRAILVNQQQEIMIRAQHTILATGGAGRLFRYSTNPTISTGEGIALAFEMGADVKHMEFVQFHPTAFYASTEMVTDPVKTSPGPRFLVSEALRGEGGVLLNKHGERFMAKYHADAELAPRDIVTRAIYEEMRVSQQPCVWLDISHLSAEKIETRFPTILKNCLGFGVDIRTDKIPVTPAAHYLMGGVVVDLDGKTSVENLYAVGETACTGLHGANRLASNSLLECVVYARRVAAYISGLEQQAQTASNMPARDYCFDVQPDIKAALDELHTLMWEHVGILRDEAGLKLALDGILELQKKLAAKKWDQVVPHGIELSNQLTTARLITVAALNREESLGAHYRIDSCRVDSCPSTAAQEPVGV